MEPAGTNGTGAARVLPVVTDSIVIGVVVGGANSLQLFGQQVGVKPGGDRQHPASVAPHVHVHVRHRRKIHLGSQSEENTREQQKLQPTPGAETFKVVFHVRRHIMAFVDRKQGQNVRQKKSRKTREPLSLKSPKFARTQTLRLISGII